VALPAIAHSTPLLQQPIDISCPPNQQQQTYSSRLLLWTHAGQTDGQTPYSFTDPALHAMRAVPTSTVL